MRVLTAGNMYPPHHHGGYELVWQSAVDHLRARGHDVRVLTTDHRTDARERDPEHVHRDLRWHWRDGDFQPAGPREVWATARHNHAALDRHLDEFAPDAVAWWSMGGLTMTLLEAVRRRGLPATAFVHDDWLTYGPKVDPWLRAFTGPRRSRLAPVAERVTGLPARIDLARAAAYVFVSESTRRRARERGVAPVGTSIAHSGIHPDYLDPAPLSDWQWRLLYVGRLDPRKGVDTAVEALAHLPAGATLTVIGGSDEREARRLASLAADLGVSERLILAGEQPRPAIAAAYGDADVIVFPVQWSEPWGLVPLEAMGRGRPVVATGRGGSGEYLRDGENCLLFDAGDAAALAGTVRRLSGDAALRERLRESGRATAEAHTEPIFNAAVEEALTSSLAGVSRAAPGATSPPRRAAPRRA